MTEGLVIVGAGLAGLVAALFASLSDPSISITVLEKELLIGGNSVRASSGINAVNSSPQLELGIQDSISMFKQDTLRAGDFLNDPKLVEVLASRSLDAFQWLEELGIQLQLVSRCGGHSVPRTHRNNMTLTCPKNVGAYMVQVLGDLIRQRQNVQIITGARVIHLEKCGQRVCGVSYEKNGEKLQIVDAKFVILASGGFGGDFSDQSMLKTHNSKAWELGSTTNGDWASGDGILLGESAGADTILMDKVQIHPTPFVDPEKPFAQSRILAAEALRGSGGILLDGSGNRFVDELVRRDELTQAILEKGIVRLDESTGKSFRSAYLFMSHESRLKFGDAFNFYLFKKLFREFSTLELACEALNLPLNSVKASISSQAPSSFFSAEFPGPLYVAEVTPSVHYTMGGLRHTERAEVLDQSGNIVPGLLCAGEVCGGVQGANRLAGNAILECVVFGRIAAQTATSSSPL